MTQALVVTLGLVAFFLAGLSLRFVRKQATRRRAVAGLVLSIAFFAACVLLSSRM